MKVKQIQIVSELNKKIFIKYNHIDEQEHTVELTYNAKSNSGLGRI